MPNGALPPGMKQINVRGPEELLGAFRTLAFNTKVSANEHVLRAMKLYLAALERQKERETAA